MSSPEARPSPAATDENPRLLGIRLPWIRIGSDYSLHVVNDLLSGSTSQGTGAAVSATGRAAFPVPMTSQSLSRM